MLENQWIIRIGWALLGLVTFSAGGCEKVKQLTTTKPVVVAPMSGPVTRELKEADYPGLVATKDRLTVVVFHATWCGPCKNLEPVMAKVANEFSGVAQVGRFDVDQCQTLSRQLGVGGIPDVRFFLNGKQVDSFLGGVSEGDLRDKFLAYSRGLTPGAKTTPAPGAGPDPSKPAPAIQRMQKDWTPPGIKKL
jgi:thiol-disulfide isomerase/thioredoxin